MVTYIVCRNCGARWTSDDQHSPRACVNEECDAGWMDLPEFADKADADRAEEAFARDRITG